MSAPPWHRPEPQLVWRAIDTYLRLAYPPPAGGPPVPPAAVRARLDVLRAAADNQFYDCPPFECAGGGPDAPPARYLLRLGNKHYPHMKLVIDRAPDGRGYLLRADTHDAHCQPRPGSPEQAAFAELSRHNRQLAESIEGSWEAENLPTFKKYLRDDLARRKGGGAGTEQ